MLTQENIQDRITELLSMKCGSKQYDVVDEIYSATLSFAAQLYGTSSPQVEAVKQLREDMQASKYIESAKAQFLVKQCQGILKSFVSDIKSGRLGILQLEYQGQVFADFLNSAKVALDSGSKDVAAVLVCAALEDALKRFGQAKGLEVEDKDLSTVINALKAAGLLSAPQGAILKGMVPLRNKALHAEWAKVDEAGVRGVMAFVEEFLIKSF